MRSIRTLIFLATLPVLFIQSVQAATFVVPPDEWLIEDTPAIVSGTVIDAYSRFTDIGEIETVFIIALDEVLKGALTSDRLELVEWGGRIGDQWMMVSGAPRYQRGKRYLIFMVPNRNGEWTTQHLTLGRFAFVPSAAGELLLRDDSEVHGWDIHGNVPVESSRFSDRFLSFIRSRVAGVSSDPEYFLDPAARPARPPMRVATQQRSIVPNFAAYDFVDASTVGVGSWADDSASTVSFSISGSAATGNTKNVGDGQERIIEEDPNGDIAGTFTGSGTVATAFMAGGSNHSFESKAYITITGSDVVVQNGVKTSGTFTQEKFRTTMVHELGHTLGFRHSNKTADNQGNCVGPAPCSSSAIMNSSVVAGLDGDLQTWDIDAVRAAYGSGGDASDYTSKFCADSECTVFTTETGRRSNTSVAFRLAQLACVAPGIGAHPQNVAIAQGASTNLTVSATGSSLSYQWYQATAPSQTNPVGTNSSTFNTGALNSAGSFNYWVKVTGSCGTANSTTATVTVSCAAPNITTNPSNKNITINTSTTITVVATGTGLTYQWYRGSASDTSNPVGTNSATLNTGTLSATTAFWVRVTGSCGTDDSTTATVTVSAGCNPPTISALKHPQSVTITTGTATTLTVDPAGTTPYTFQWFRASSPSQTNPVGTNSDTLNTGVLNANTNFWVKVTNSCGSVNSNTATVTVTSCALPVITAEPADQSIGSGSSVGLSVAATNATSFTWYRGIAPDQTTQVGTGASFNTGALTATTNYWVKVTNTCGSVNSRTATVTVSTSCGNPFVAVPPLSQQIRGGDDFVLAVIPSGTPPFNYQWYEGSPPDTTKPVGSNASTFSSSSVFKTTSFWVRITDACGSVDSAAAVITVPRTRIRSVRRR